MSRRNWLVRRLQSGSGHRYGIELSQIGSVSRQDRANVLPDPPGEPPHLQGHGLVVTLGHFFRVESLLGEGEDLPDPLGSLVFPSSHSPEYRLLALIQSRVSSVWETADAPSKMRGQKAGCPPGFGRRHRQIRHWQRNSDGSGDRSRDDRDRRWCGLLAGGWAGAAGRAGAVPFFSFLPWLPAPSPLPPTTSCIPQTPSPSPRQSASSWRIDVLDVTGLDHRTRLELLQLRVVPGVGLVPLVARAFRCGTATWPGCRISPCA